MPSHPYTLRHFWPGVGPGISVFQAVWFLHAARVENHCFGRTCVQLHPATSHPYPPSASGEKASCLPEEKQKSPLGIEATDVIFLVCGISFCFFCKINTTKVLEKSEKKPHSCSFFTSVLAQQPGQPLRLNAFVSTGTFFSPLQG